ncbi:MAG: short-chain dehydrogenase [Acidobacteriota bacterium]
MNRSRWRDADARRLAAAHADPLLGLRVYTSRLLGADPRLVLHGGGNTSVKSEWTDPLGTRRAALWVKGSGADLAVVDARGFAPVDLPGAVRLLALERLGDSAMLAELRRLRFDSEAPTPSVETLLHAFLPFRFVDHTHADDALAVLTSRDATRRAEDLWGEDHVLVPYVMPGFDLARSVADLWTAATTAGRKPIGLILLRHGVFSFADDARESYERMLAAVERARRIRAPRIAVATAPRPARAPEWTPRDLAALRARASALAGKPLVAVLDDSRAARRISLDRNLVRAVARGPLTPDHTLRTKPWPVLVASPARIDEVLERFAASYRRYFETQRRGRELTMLDPAPRVAWLAGAGVVGLGETAAAARAALDLAQHTWPVAERAERLGGYRPLPAARLFDVEYWELEQAKLRRGGARPTLAGRVALVTGAAHGIGRAAVDALLEAGAAVVGLDLEATDRGRLDYAGVAGDATRAAVVARAIDTAARRFGGLDILVSNVGVFVAGPKIEEIALEDFRRALEINVTSHVGLLRAAAPLTALAPGGGAVVVIGSRNVLAPGPGAAAYSASKAALTQLARVAALELAPRGVRVNVLHPDNVFDTELWTQEMLAARAERYGLTVEQYKRRNLLGRDVRAADVGRLAAALAGDLFRVTTGAQIPVDGGSDRVI